MVHPSFPPSRAMTSGNFGTFPRPSLTCASVECVHHHNYCPCVCMYVWVGRRGMHKCRWRRARRGRRTYSTLCAAISELFAFFFRSVNRRGPGLCRSVSPCLHCRRHQRFHYVSWKASEIMRALRNGFFLRVAINNAAPSRRGFFASTDVGVKWIKTWRHFWFITIALFDPRTGLRRRSVFTRRDCGLNRTIRGYWALAPSDTSINGRFIRNLIDYKRITKHENN